MSSEEEVRCTDYETSIFPCERGECMVNIIGEVRHKHCKCDSGWTGIYCDRAAVDISLFASTQLDKKDIATIAVVCSVVLIIIGVIIFFVVRKVRQNRRRANDALPIVTVGGQTDCSATDTTTVTTAAEDNPAITTNGTDAHPASNSNGAVSPTNPDPSASKGDRKNSVEPVNTHTVAVYI